MPSPLRATFRTLSLVAGASLLLLAPAAAAPTGLRSCDTDLVANRHASCAFARSVKAAYLSADGDGTHLSVTSPTTGERYDVACIASASMVECTAGTNAYINFPVSAATATTEADAAGVTPAPVQTTSAALEPAASIDKESSSMDDTSNAILILAIVAAALAWIVPSILVAAHASRNGFRFWSFLVVALFLSWPLALFGDVLFGARSPLVRQRHASTDDVAYPSPSMTAVD